MFIFNLDHSGVWMNTMMLSHEHCECNECYKCICSLPLKLPVKLCID